MKIKRLAVLALAALLVLTAGCAKRELPFSAKEIVLADSDASRLLEMFVQNYTVYELGWGNGQALMEIVFYEEGKPVNSMEVGPMSAEAHGEYVFALMQYQAVGEAAFKATIAQLKDGVSYAAPYIPSGDGPRGSRYSAGWEYDGEEMANGGRLPLYGIFFKEDVTTPIPSEPDAATAIEDSSIAVVFYVTVSAE